MGNNNDLDYMFFIEGDDTDEKKSAEEFVDIMSDSSMKNRKRSRYAKKKKGFPAWWSKRKGWQKGLMISGVAILLVVAILFGVIRTQFDYNYKEITKDPIDLGFEEVLDESIVNIALFGIDTRNPKSFEGLSDSIMILSLNKGTKQVKIISIMRDTLTPITYNGKTTYGKINSAYQKGGPELAIKTLNKNFNLDISEYATVNFYGMADIIEAVGGIEAELTKSEVKKYDGTQHSINGCIYEICKHLGLNPKDYYIFQPGVHHLNGVQAVAYSRIRYVSNIWGTNNDYGRTDRQRYVMEQLFNKALTIEKSKYPKLAKALIPCSETSLSYSEIIDLAFDILLDSPTFGQARVPQEEYQMKQPSTKLGSVVYYDLEFAGKLIHAFIYDDITPDDYIDKNGVEKNPWYKGGSSSGSSNKNNSSSSSSKNESTEKPDDSDEDSSDEVVDSDIEGTESDGSDTEDGEGNESTGSSEGGNSSDASSGNGSDAGSSDGASSGSGSSGGSSDSSGGASSGGSSDTSSGGTSTTPSSGGTENTVP